MLLIAKRDFRNPQRAIKIEGAKHPDHIHQGATFEIGGKADYDALNPQDKQLVALLNAADCIGDASDRKIVGKVQAAISEREKAEASTAKAVK